jgi:putative DNA primase/helicase
MTPALSLFDPQLERLFVAALIQDPRRHNLHDIALQDLQDPHAARAFEAFTNVPDPTVRNLEAWLQVEYDRKAGPHRAGELAVDLGWFRSLVQTALPPDPPLHSWANSILRFSEIRREALEDAEPPPRRPVRGPRAENTEPVRLAEAFRRFSYERDGESTLVRWARAWWRYNGTRYVELDDELLDRSLIAFLDVVVAPAGTVDPITKQQRTELKRVTSRNKTLSEVRKALTFVMPTIEGGAPQWTALEEHDADPDQLVVCGNGILNLRSLDLRPSTPRFFATTAIGAPWDPNAPIPVRWLEFLRSLWGDDAESILTLQQLFGYLLTHDTSLQKIFALIGPPRSGKGTIARVLKALLGDDAVVNPTLQSLERPFGLAPLVGKTAAIIGDARLGGHSDQQQVVERLLSISGEDSLSIDRKNRDPINVRLRVRVILLTNELPKLYDTSGALASRFVILTLARSFVGEEDTGLEAKLLTELPGIFRWAMDGLQDLRERGRFVQPLASERAYAHLQAISSPMSVFWAEVCVADPAGEVEVDVLYQRYTAWCESNGREPANKQVFGRDLHTLHPELSVRHPRRGDGTRYRVYDGVRLA